MLCPWRGAAAIRRRPSVRNACELYFHLRWYLPHAYVRFTGARRSDIFCLPPCSPFASALLGLYLHATTRRSTLITTADLFISRSSQVLPPLLQRDMAMTSNAAAFRKSYGLEVSCRKREKKEGDHFPYKVVEITPPPKNLGVRCLPSNMQRGESVTIEGQTYTISAVIHRYQLRNGKYEPSEKRLDVLSTGRYILNLYLENLLKQS